MSAVVKLSSRMPGDFETNGIDAHAARLVEHPDDLLVCVVWVDTQRVVIDTDSGDKIPTIRVRRIEPLGEVGDVSAAIRDAVQIAVRTRTGRTPMPFELGGVEEGFDPDQESIDL